MVLVLPTDRLAFIVFRIPIQAFRVSFHFPFPVRRRR
jgi:hypothetical protein